MFQAITKALEPSKKPSIGGKIKAIRMISVGKILGTATDMIRWYCQWANTNRRSLEVFSLLEQDIAYCTVSLSDVLVSKEVG